MSAWIRDPTMDDIEFPQQVCATDGPHAPHWIIGSWRAWCPGQKEEAMNPLHMEIGVDAGGEHGQHGEVSIVMTTEQADMLARVMDVMPDDIGDERFARLLVRAIKEAL